MVKPGTDVHPLGLSNGTTKYGDCCSGISFCPAIANECTSHQSCCQTGFPLLCSTSEGTWCCTNDYPVCGPGKQCLSASGGGNCDCGQCVLTNPCKYIGCSSCKTCCDLYTPAICTGPASCGDNSPEATRNIPAKFPCSQPLDKYSQNISIYMIAFSCAAYYVTDEAPSQPDLGPSFDMKHKFVVGYYAAYLAIDKINNAIVFGFRGTVSGPYFPTQIMLEIIATIRKLDGYYWPRIPEVTTTMYFTIGALQILQRAQAPLQQLMKQFPNYRVWFTGHSLGGSMASIAAFSLVNDGIVTNPLVYTFGEARAGNSEYAFMYNSLVPNTYRVVLQGDIIPHLPPCDTPPDNPAACDLTKSKFWGYHHNSEIWLLILFVVIKLVWVQKIEEKMFE